MALRWIEGFESYSGDIHRLSGRYTINNLAASSFQPGRLLGLSLVFNGTSFTTSFINNHTTWIVGMAFMNVNITSGQWTILACKDGATAQLALVLNSTTKHFSVYRGNTLLATGTRTINLGTWYFVELKFIINPSTGAVELKINETVDINISSQNTRVTGVSQVNTFSFMGTNHNGKYQLDDFYLCDGSGSINNDFLGDNIVCATNPSIEGNYANWIPSVDSPNYQCVGNERDGKFIQTNTPTTKDSYKFNNIVKISTNVVGVQLCAWAANTDSTNHTFNAITRISNTDYDSVNTASITSMGFEPSYFIFETDPSTSAPWNVSAINTAEFGIKLDS